MTREQQGPAPVCLKRRGLIAGAAALVAGVLAKRSVQTVEAAYSFQGDSTANPGTVPTSLTATAGFSGSTLFTLDASAATGTVEGLRVLGGNSRSAIISIAKGATLPTSFYCAIYGTGRGTGTTPATGASGVLGDSTNFVGVRGFSDNYYGVHGTGSIGVYGNNAASGTGVWGDGATGVGVMGAATSGTGIVGSSSTGIGLSVTTTASGKPALRAVNTSFTDVSTDAGDGIQGYTNSNVGSGVSGINSGTSGAGVKGSSAGGIGVAGTAIAGTGVQGTSTSGIGVYGSSANFHGVYAEAGNSQGAGALVGVTRTTGGVAFQAVCVAPATNAGYFQGNVSVFGSLGVSGGKFAVVKGSDGKYRGMYAVESPECWFEDFGTGKIVGGKADVTLDPLFAQHVHTNDYHVFVTAHDEEHHLAVKGRTATGFAVAASASAEALAKGKKGTDLSGTFSYRVVAKRNDIAGERLPVWETPPGAGGPSVPKPPTPVAPPQPAPPPRPAPPAASPAGRDAGRQPPGPVPRQG